MISAGVDSTTLDIGGLQMSALAAGPDTGEPVILLHGFPDTNRTLARQVASLGEAGYRAVAPMLRGYEPSSQPDLRTGTYHPVRAADDLVALAASMGGSVHAVGHDWGSVVVQAATLAAPQLFLSATLIAVAPVVESAPRILRLPGQLVNSAYMLLFQARGLSERIVARDDFAFVEALWRRWSPGWAPDPEDLAAVKRTLARPGVLTAALSYYRAMFAPRSTEARRFQGLLRHRVEVPTLAVTGADDRCMDTRVFDGLDTSRFAEGLRVERLGGGHWTHLEDFGTFDALLREWTATHARQP